MWIFLLKGKTAGFPFLAGSRPACKELLEVEGSGKGTVIEGWGCHVCVHMPLYMASIQPGSMVEAGGVVFVGWHVRDGCAGGVGIC